MRRRYEYTSHLCDLPYSSNWDHGGGSKAWCISEWDILPQSLPAEHTNIDYGISPGKNYSIFSSAGGGATQYGGGNEGVSSEFQIRTGGDAAVIMGDGRIAVYTQSAVAEWGGGLVPEKGMRLKGGRGADGFKGAGGGGGGYWGGGGGGSGIDASGGGGGSSYSAVRLSTGRLLSTGESIKVVSAATQLPIPFVTFINDSAASFSWDNRWPGITVGSFPVEYYIELSYGAHSDDFQLYFLGIPGKNVFSSSRNLDSCDVGGLSSETTYRFRVVPLYSRSVSGRGHASMALAFTTLSPATNYWEPIKSRRLSLASTGRGISGPVVQRPNIDIGAEIFTERETLNFDPENRYVDANTDQKQVYPSSRRGHTMTFVPDKGYMYLFGGRTDGMILLSLQTNK